LVLLKLTAPNYFVLLEIFLASRSCVFEIYVKGKRRLLRGYNMRKFSAILPVIVLLLMLGFSNSYALNITIVESQSFNPSHTMDIEWATVAASMGHIPTIVPQSTLDTGAFIPGTDVLIISSPYIPLTAVRMSFVYDCMYSGRGVYVQSEAFMTDEGNITWQNLVNMYGTAFTWLGTMGGIMRPTVHNHIGAEFNAKPVLNSMWDGCFATWGPGVEGNLRWQNNEIGYCFDPLNFPFAGYAITNTDMDWILLAPDYPLMENYIDVLIDQPMLELNLRLGPVGGPIILPSGGGVFSYEAQINYTGWLPVTFRAWIRLILPSGAVYPPPLVGPATFTWGAPTTTPLYTFTQFIPPFAPFGTYYVQGVLADFYPGFTTVWDTENFSFQKLIVAADGEETEPITDFKSTGSFELMSEAVGEESALIPDAFIVSEAYPNPFNPSTTVNIGLGEASHLSVTVFDIQGREVASLANDQFAAGQHSFSFDANGLASGVYMLRAISGSNVQTRKLVLMH
jgi:Secretion system C-terminal sorting domain